ncbi:MAG: preprotein translocase subunit SecA [Ancalomicrobiaceae bacterium]|nr:preprotein translocase subunit SecA [Ancalomicrobiaceae bacterium]
MDELAARARALWLVATPHARARRLHRILPLVETHAAAYAALNDDALEAEARLIAVAFRRQPDFPDGLTGRAFALIREMSGRVLGKRHYDVQILGAFAMVKGMLAEMATGEGKTLTATLVAGAAGLAGVPIHVVTVNDYLAKRDAELMSPLYAKLGLSVGIVMAGQSFEERRAAYQCDIVYCTNKELAFDYLRDRMEFGQAAGDLALKIETLHAEHPRAAKLRLRGLHFALVDEADSVLIDEARTPLIISGQAVSLFDHKTVAEAHALARTLVDGTDYFISKEDRRIFLTHAGQARVEAFAGSLAANWRGTVAREELARQALSALHLFRRDEHYVVADGKVAIVDEYTGRMMPDRFWGDGLHQMIEYKEGCELSGRRATIARMTYQRMFRRYKRLAGMSGTVRSMTRELWQVYRLPVVAIPTAKPVQRIHRPTVVVATVAEKWARVIERTQELHRRGIPVLIGTSSVASSFAVSEALGAAGLPHQVLNALQDQHEAEIVSEAGQSGRITVATNMAGRGTDIHLGPGVAELGGLHVIMTERHDARRIDLQLAGRAGRQGEPGSFEAILSLEDPLMDKDAGVASSRLAKLAQRLLGDWIGGAAADYAQRRAEHIHARMRAQLLKSDQMNRKTLAFTGRPE